MDVLRVARYLAFGMAALCAGASAQAFQLSGTFAGIADAYPLPIPHIPPPSLSAFDGAAVTGSFAFDIPNPQFQALADPELEIFSLGDDSAFTISFNINGRRFDYAATSSPLDPGVLMLTSSPTFQAFSLYNSLNTFNNAVLTLSGPPGSLFSGFDPATLHIDPTQSYVLAPSFNNDALRLGINVDVTESHLNTAAPVPEPASVSLLLLGGALLAGAASRRKAGA